MGEIKPSEVSAILRQQLAGFTDKSELEETGVILEVGDGIAHVYGLTNAQSGELIFFDKADVQGIVLNLEDDNVGIVLLGDAKDLNEGDICRRTRRIASIKVNENMLGRVINTLGEPIDGKGPIEGQTYELPLERKAPGVIYRQPVKEPLQTGIKAIDAMIPIGRGQRELIIGDRQIGKTAIAIDTIINQKEFYDKGEPVYCIYVAVGQKGSTVANIVKTLTDYGAMAYTTIVAATASDPAAMQYYAPYAGAAIGEFFRQHIAQVIISTGPQGITLAGNHRLSIQAEICFGQHIAHIVICIVQGRIITAEHIRRSGFIQVLLTEQPVVQVIFPLDPCGT